MENLNVQNVAFSKFDGAHTTLLEFDCVKSGEKSRNVLENMKGRYND